MDFKEVVERINQYLAQVTIEQFESDLQKAGIEQCPDIGEEADCEWQPERLIVQGIVSKKICIDQLAKAGKSESMSNMYS